MIMPSEYKHLFDINTDFIIDNFGKDFVIRAHARKLTKEESLEANEILSKILYPNGLADLLRGGCFSDVTALSLKNIKAITSNRSDIIDSIIKNGAGLILIRPEMLHAHKLVERFLTERRFKVEISLEKKIDFNSYWAIYNDGLINPDSFLDFPTRTLIYTSGHCRLIIFTDPKNRYGSKMMDDFCRLFKGEEGVIKEGTIRGEIVLRELLRVGVGDRSKKDLEFILDPIGMYRHIVDANIPSDGIHNKCDHPFLHYAGAGVHIPDSGENSLNFRALLSDSDIVSK